MEIEDKRVVAPPAPAEPRLAVAPPGSAAAPPWREIYASTEFRTLMAAKWRFLTPAIIFFLAYYFALPLLNGLAPGLMKTNVIGHINLAYLFAFSEFVMAWVLAYLYIRKATNVFDRLAERVRQVAARKARGEA